MADYKLLTPKEKALLDIYEDTRTVFVMALNTARDSACRDDANMMLELDKAEKMISAAIQEARDKLEAINTPAEA